MLLLIDSGNTRIKWAVVDARAPVHTFVDGTTPNWHASGVVAPDELAHVTKAWKALAISRAVIANVAGTDRQHQLARYLQQDCALPVEQIGWFVSVAQAAGVRNGYRVPSQLGCDRFASLIGARALFPDQRLLVVTCGTATTIDALDRDGVFTGGLILPGLGLMATALAQQTAQLPQIDEAFVAPTLFADHTDAAIRSGCLTAQAGAITVALTTFQGARCILSGGAARFVTTALTPPHHLIDNLVLRGLQAASRCNLPC